MSNKEFEAKLEVLFEAYKEDIKYGVTIVDPGKYKISRTDENDTGLGRANSHSLIGTMLRMLGSDYRPNGFPFCPGWDIDISSYFFERQIKEEFKRIDFAVNFSTYRGMGSPDSMLRDPARYYAGMGSQTEPYRYQPKKDEGIAGWYKGMGDPTAPYK